MFVIWSGINAKVFLRSYVEVLIIIYVRYMLDRGCRTVVRLFNFYRRDAHAMKWVVEIFSEYATANKTCLSKVEKHRM